MTSEQLLALLLLLADLRGQIGRQSLRIQELETQLLESKIAEKTND